MSRAFFSGLVIYSVGLVIYSVASSGWAQPADRTVPNRSSTQPHDRIVLGETTEFLSAGAEAIRVGNYDDGIRLTSLGLERDAPNAYQRAAALANLCAAHAAKGAVDTAIRYCSESLAINAGNWRAFSNRSYAYYLKGKYFEARLDLDAAAAIAPNAPQVKQIRGMLNEQSLTPRVIMEEHR
jgi:tetratricopeptide (TPR) repeat protein